MRKQTTLVLATAIATMLLALVPTAGADEQYEFESPVYDIASAPDGSVLVGENVAQSGRAPALQADLTERCA